jgi:hypothetical protein
LPALAVFAPVKVPLHLAAAAFGPLASGPPPVEGDVTVVADAQPLARQDTRLNENHRADETAFKLRLCVRPYLASKSRSGLMLCAAFHLRRAWIKYFCPSPRHGAMTASRRNNSQTDPRIGGLQRDQFRRVVKTLWIKAVAGRKGRCASDAVCYRYAWAERAKVAGMPERFAQEALGHNSKTVHRAYANRALMRIPSLEDYERKSEGAISQVTTR